MTPSIKTSPLHHQMGGHRSTLPGRSGAVGGGGGVPASPLNDWCHFQMLFLTGKRLPLLICCNLATLASLPLLTIEIKYSLQSSSI